jgi:tetratricopeptide (TPR) repeat protein
VRIPVKFYFQIFLVLLLVLVEAACTGGTAEQHWILAEKLFHSDKHEEAIKQFRKAIEADPKSQVGQKALLRIAEIQSTNLNQPNKAAKSYRQFIGRSTAKSQKALIKNSLNTFLHLMIAIFFFFKLENRDTTI